MHKMSKACSNISVVRQQLVSVGESRGCTLMVRDLHHGSLSGVLYGYARLPTLPVVRMGINHFCFFPVNLVHLLNCMLCYS